MESKDKVIIGLVILIVSVVLLNVMTGNITEAIKNKSCTDSDGGHDYSVKGTTESRGNIETERRVDSCATASAVKEYYCNQDKVIESEIVDCTGLGKTKCELGRCII